MLYNKIVMNTIILAAGPVDYRNKSQGISSSRHLAIVNGRPVITWVVRDILKNVEDSIYITIDKNDTDLYNFCYKHWAHNPRINLCVIDNDASIIYSLAMAVKKCGDDFDHNPARIILGDTLFIDTPYENDDKICVSHFELDSSNWCVANILPDGRLVNYKNKLRGLDGHTYVALMGRYEFSSGRYLKEAIQGSLENNDKELSDVLNRYSERKPLYARLVPESDCIDFGHLEGIAQARVKLMESRSFNTLTVDPIFPEICKNSKNIDKLDCEARWYNDIPVRLKALTPRILEYHPGKIRMEYYGYGTLAEKFLYGDLHFTFWKQILDRLFSLVIEMSKFSAPIAIDYKNIYKIKTNNRLNRLYKDSFFSEILNLNEIYIGGEKYSGLPKLIDFIQEEINKLCNYKVSCVCHGDLCFSNILYDIHSGVIKLIDPRGNQDGSPCIYGDPRYDIAKLRHSFCGNYDFIIEGDFFIERINKNTYEFEIFSKSQEEREHIFDDLCLRYGFDISEISFIEALLFLTMIPLHDDSQNRQMAFYLIALKKFNNYFREQICVSA